MPSYELEPFTPNRNIRIVAATEILLPFSVRVLFWMNDPEQQVIWPNAADNLESCISSPFDADDLGYPRRDYLWQHTCFELFVGIKNKSLYREINLSPADIWNCYGFDDYRTPDQIPPIRTRDISLLELKSQPQRLEAVLSFQQFFAEYQCGWNDLKIGISSVIQTRKPSELYFALQHTAEHADFHHKRDWVGSF